MKICGCPLSLHMYKRSLHSSPLRQTSSFVSKASISFSERKALKNFLTILRLGRYVTPLRKVVVIPYKVLLYVYLFSLRFWVSIHCHCPIDMCLQYFVRPSSFLAQFASFVSFLLYLLIWHIIITFLFTIFTH
jgi:hypothetical protein